MGRKPKEGEEKLTQVNMSMDKPTAARVTEIAKELNITKSEMFRYSLLLLQTVMRERAAGNQVCVCKNGKVLKEIVGIGEKL